MSAAGEKAMKNPMSLIWATMAALLITGTVAAGYKTETQETTTAAAPQTPPPGWQCGGFLCK
jgi:hypothetical protein